MTIEQPSDGVFLNIQHAIGWVWDRDETLSACIPVSSDKACLNRLHLYGTNHITDNQLRELAGSGRAYGVVDDLTLGGRDLGGRITHGAWPVRIRVFTDCAASSTRCPKRLLERLKEEFPNGFQTECASICRFYASSMSLIETANHYRGEITIQFRSTL